MKNLNRNREQGFGLANERSWFLKRLFWILHLTGISIACLIYTGYLEIDHKPLAEYLTLTSTALFLWSFSIDFKKFKMDVEKIPKVNEDITSIH
jgi:hypothetical protein